MRRTQLYLEDDLWALLHQQARVQGESVSELVRRAVRERYLGDVEKRRQAMLGIIGIWKDREDIGDAEAYVHDLRSSGRLGRRR